MINDIIVKELGDVSGKNIIHLQCNTGADSISLARMGAKVTGVDLVPDNIFYGNRLAEEFGLKEMTRFMESNIMDLMEKHNEKYDIVFTSEGAIGWLPDLEQWAKTIRHLLKDEGFLYVFDSHPFLLMLDEEKIDSTTLNIKYPYFDKGYDESDEIGGYASDVKIGKNYFWDYTVGDIINSLSKAGLCVESFNEYDLLYFNLGGEMEKIRKGLYQTSGMKGKFPLTFSLKATVR
ncbi:MAG: class I SAM-dependent methyltransferase [Bacillus sp. (in: Bacteria)]|nr:class I SAM-dependent methyltransferase [Bacillus sp. (in: firmicutes)]